MKLLPVLTTTTTSNPNSTTSSDQPKSPPSSSSSPWQWSACAHLETHSSRAITAEVGVESLTKMNMMVTEAPVSCFTTETSSKTTSTRSEESGSDPIETVIRGLRSDRLFFEPEESNSILEEAKKSTTVAATRDRGGSGLDLVPYKESVFVSMESTDPFIDFRASMLEMIEAHGLKDWECLEELLGWYLKVNGKANHGYIIGAFVDLLASIFSSNLVSSERTETTTATVMAAGSSSSSSFSCICSPSSPLSLPSSSLTTPCLSSLDQVDEDDDENGEESSHHLVS